MDKKLLDNRIFKTRINSNDVKLKELVFGYFLGPCGGLLSGGILSTWIAKYWSDYLFADVLATPSTGEALAVKSFLSILPAISAIIIVIGNLISGQIIERTRSSAGKARPWILLSALTLSFTSFMLFASPLILGSEIRPVSAMILTGTAYVLYYAFAYPLYSTANSTLIAVSTRDVEKRGVLASASNIAMTVGAGVGSLVMPFVVGFMIPDGADKAVGRDAFMTIFFVVALISFAFTLLQYYFTRERITEEAATQNGERQGAISIKKQLSGVSGDPCWWIALIVIFLSTLGGGVKNAGLAYYSELMDKSFWSFMGVEGNAAAGMTMTLFGIAGSIPMTLSVLVIVPLSNKYGKKAVICCGFIVSIVGDLVATLGKSDVVVCAIGVALKLLGSAPINYLMLALVSDVLDGAEARMGYRSDGLMMSIYSSITVACGPIATALLMAITGAGTDSSTYAFGYLWVEGIAFAVAFILMLAYDPKALKKRK